MNAHELKQLQVRKAKIEAEMVTLKDAKNKAILAYEDATQELRTLDNEIKAFAKEPVVSEHALLRYFEREMGYNLDIIRAKILTDQNKSMIRKLVSGKFPFGKNKLVVKDMVVVSIAP